MLQLAIRHVPNFTVQKPNFLQSPFSNNTTCLILGALTHIMLIASLLRIFFCSNYYIFCERKIKIVDTTILLSNHKYAQLRHTSCVFNDIIQVAGIFLMTYQPRSQLQIAAITLKSVVNIKIILGYGQLFGSLAFDFLI